MCWWPENQTICETHWKKDGRSELPCWSITKLLYQLQTQIVGEILQLISYVVPCWLRHLLQTRNPSPPPPMVSGLVGALFNSDRTGKQWCNSDNQDDTPSIYQIVDTQYGGRSCGSLVYLDTHEVPVCESTLGNAQHLGVLCVLSQYESVPHCSSFGLFHLDVFTLLITGEISALNSNWFLGCDDLECPTLMLMMTRKKDQSNCG